MTVAIRSQESAILGDLQAGLSITPLDALNRFGCFRLAAVIFNLRKQGYKIITGEGTSADGKRFARYYMAKPAAEQPEFPFI